MIADLTTYAPVLVFALAGVWRYIKGGDHKPPGWDYVGLALAWAGAWLATADPVALVPATVAWLTLKLGYTDWEDLRWMLMRYGLPPFAATLAYAVWVERITDYATLVPALGGFIAGAIYGILSPRYGERWLRIPAGCLIVGATIFYP